MIITIISLRSWQGIVFFPRIFFLLFCLFHVYHLANPFGFGYTALATVALFMLHSMLFFWHRYELPAVARGWVTIDRPRMNTNYQNHNNQNHNNNSNNTSRISSSIPLEQQHQQQHQSHQLPNEIFSTPARFPPQQPMLLQDENSTPPLGFRGEEPLHFQSPYNQEEEDENATPPLGFRREELLHFQTPYDQQQQEEEEEEEDTNHDAPTLRRSLPSFSTVSSRQPSSSGLFQNEEDDDSYAFMLGGEVVLHRQSSNDSNNNNLANGSPTASVDRSNLESNHVDNSNSTDESSPPIITPLPSRSGGVPPSESTVATTTPNSEDPTSQPPPRTPQPWIVPRSASDYSEESSGLQAILEVRLTPRHRNSTTTDASPRQPPPPVPDFFSSKSR
jgi:hypothetical protein